MDATDREHQLGSLTDHTMACTCIVHACPGATRAVHAVIYSDGVPLYQAQSLNTLAGTMDATMEATADINSEREAVLAGRNTVLTPNP